MSFAREDGTSAGTKEAGGSRRTCSFLRPTVLLCRAKLQRKSSDPAELEFEVMKRKYIYPFNTPSNPRLMDPILDPLKIASSAQGKETNQGKGDDVGDETFREQDGTGTAQKSEKILKEELQRPLQVTMRPRATRNRSNNATDEA